jgi:hypothetical protein
MNCEMTFKNNTILSLKKKASMNEGFVGTDGIEPPTQGFSVLCSTD